MHSADVLTTIYRHNLWANQRLLECCAKLTDEQLDSTISGTFGTIRDTLVHIITSEQSYLVRISTGKPRPKGDGEKQYTIAELMTMAQSAGQGLVEWASKVKPEETVVVDWDGVPRDVPKTIILTQAIHHSIEHRAQVMTVLTQLGVEPPDLQGWEFFDKM
jgi:uncharacterized damage-inducible protein DinB